MAVALNLTNYATRKELEHATGTKTKLKSIKGKDIGNWLNTKKSLTKEISFVFSQYKKMSEKTLKFDNIKVNKK